MLTPAFQINVRTPILPGLVTVGKFDGVHSSLACATAAAKVFVHSPHDHSLDVQNNVRFLNINRTVTALTVTRARASTASAASTAVAAGASDATAQQAASSSASATAPAAAAAATAAAAARDVLVIGSPTNVLVYDVDNNKDVFFKEVSEGVSSACAGRFGSFEEPLVIVGGNCSIQGFDGSGAESFWTVAGDNITSMAILDVEGAGKASLVVGSQDFEIRVFRDEEVIQEVTESAVPVAFVQVSPGTFAFALDNGTIGVYRNGKRLWRSRYRGKVQALTAFDIDNDGEMELITGWSSGRIDVRRVASGDALFKDSIAGGVAGLLVSDYRQPGVMELICCGTEGEIRGYAASDRSAQNALSPKSEMRKQLDIELRDLSEQRQALQREIRTIEESMRVARGEAKTGAGALPPDTQVDAFWRTNSRTHETQLVLRPSGSQASSCVVRAVMLFADGAFESDSLFVHPPQALHEFPCTLKFIKDFAGVMRAKVFVGTLGATQFHTFELDIQVPKFSMFARCSTPVDTKDGVSFKLSDRAPRVARWINASFVVGEPPLPLEITSDIDVSYVSVRDATPLRIQYSSVGGAGSMRISTTSMDVAGDIVQDLASFLGLAELHVVASFPAEIAAFAQVLQRVEEYNAVRQRMSADIAETAGVLKAFVVRAEDARLLGDMGAMRRHYTQLWETNSELIGEYTKRANNHQALLDALRQVNQMIQKAAKLRVGPQKTAVITECRDAVRRNNVQQLVHIIQQGVTVAQP